MLKKLLSTILSLALITGLLPGMSVVNAASGDTDKPVLEELYTVQESFQTDGQVEVIAKFYEPSGVDIGSASLLAGKMGVSCPYSYNVQNWDALDCTEEICTEDEVAQGYCAVRFLSPVNEYFSTGTYYIGQLNIKDNEQNEVFYHTYNEEEFRIRDKFFSVTNDNWRDYTIPQLERVSLDKTEVNAGESITCSIVATDESGINQDAPGFVNIECEQNGQWNTYDLSVSAEENTYSYTFDITEDTIPGTYYISSAAISDNAGMTYYARRGIDRTEFTQEDFWSYGKMPDNSQLEFTVTNGDYVEKEAPRVTEVQFLQDSQLVEEVYAGDLMEFAVTVDDGGTAIEESMYLRLNKKGSGDYSDYQVDGVNLQWDEASRTYRGKYYVPSGWNNQDIHMGYMIYHKDGYTTQYSAWEDEMYTAPVLHVKSVFSGAEDLTVKKGSTVDLLSGITAQNLTDGDMTNEIQVHGRVNTERTGIYRIRYEISCDEIAGDDLYRESGTYITSRWIFVTDAVSEDESISILSKDDLYVGDFSEVAVYKDGAPYQTTDSCLTDDGYYDVKIKEGSEEILKVLENQNVREMSVNSYSQNDDTKDFRVAVDKTAPVIILTETGAGVSVECQDMLTVKTVKYMKGSQKAETVSKKGIDIVDRFDAESGTTYTVYVEDMLGNGAVKEITTKSVPKEYKITYHLNGGKNSTQNPSSYTSGQGSVTLKAATREGYTFAGWYLDSKLTKKTMSVTGKEEKNLDIYAKWTKVTTAQTSIISLKNSGSAQLNVEYKAISGAKGYEIVYAKNSAFTSGKKTTTSTSSKISVKGLESGTAYYVKVRAYKLDSTGKKVYGSYSSAKSYKTAPSAPKITKITGGDKKITVAWSKVTGASKYQLYMATSKTGTYSRVAEVSSGTTSYTKTGLSPARNYYFKVRAYNTSGSTNVYGSFSQINYGTTAALTPGIKSVKGGVKKAVITWNKVTGASGYHIYMATSKNGTYQKVGSVGSGSSSYTKTALSNAKNYYFKIRTYRKGEGSAVVYSSFSPVKYCGTATSVPSISAVGSGDRQLTVKWGNVSGETKYVVYMASSANGTYSKIATVSANKCSYTKTGRSTGKTYYFKVRAYRTVNGVNVYSDYSKAKSGKTAEKLYVTQSGKKYHRASCATIKRSKNLKEVTKKEAAAKGYAPCSVCKP